MLDSPALHYDQNDVLAFSPPHSPDSTDSLDYAWSFPVDNPAALAARRAAIQSMPKFRRQDADGGGVGNAGGGAPPSPNATTASIATTTPPPPSEVDSVNSPANNASLHKAKVFVGGLNWDTSEDKLRAYFSQFGTIAQCVIMTDSATKRSRGFGFVTFSDPSVVDAILSRTHVLDGKTIDPKRAIPKSSIVVAPEIPQSVQPQQQQQQIMMQSNLSTESIASNVSIDKIFVGGLPSDATDAHMRAVFERYGKLVECCAMVDKDTGRMRGFGFVRFSDAACVERVLEAQKRGGVVICGKLVEVKKATPKTKMVAPPPISTLLQTPTALSSNPLGLNSLTSLSLNPSTLPLSMSNMLLNPLSPTTALPQHRFSQQPAQPQQRFQAPTLSPLTLSPTSPQAGGPLLLPKRFLNATQPYKLQPPASRARAHSITTLQQQQQQQPAPAMGFRRGSAPYASGWEVALMEEEMRIRSRQLQIQQLREQQQIQAQMQQLQMQQFQMWQMQQQQQNGGANGGIGGGFMM